MERPAKRRAPDDAGQNRAPTSLTRSISPPGPSKLKRARISEPAAQDEEETSSEAEDKAQDDDDETSSEAEDDTPLRASSSKPTSTEATKPKQDKPGPTTQKVFQSPFQLTKIIPIHTKHDYPPEYNIETVSLHDLLSDPLISELWEFNYLHDIDFLMSHLDPDVRHLVQVHVVHGFWKKEDANRLALQEQASQYENVTLHAAFMPEMFGTHHSKMMILLRRDDTAQVVIHTANMIARDWGGMTQAVWRSPMLPLLKKSTTPTTAERGNNDGQQGKLEIGSGERFKVDFLNYLLSYEKRRPTCRGIIEELRKYDFSAVRGALVGSVPGRHGIHGHDDGSETLWGWAAMKQALKAVPIQAGKAKAEIAIQVSSIATLGPTDNWLSGTLFEAFCAGKVTTTQSSQSDSARSVGSKMMGFLGKSQQLGAASKPGFKVIFPTADEIRSSLDGYNSGGSIHTKISSAQQKKQLLYLKPMFYHWGNEPPPSPPPPGPSMVKTGGTEGSTEVAVGVMNAGRNRAAPHIKTYIRYSNLISDTTNNVDIEWALLTSANLSKQAWGEAPSSSGEMRIASYELGVLVWPALFTQGAVMRGTFLTDTPTPSSSMRPEEAAAAAVVGLRLPYSLPLRKYGQDEIPWVAAASYDEPDWRGVYWRD
ncbi:tyrosyl-DNA phosphodiesterase I [Rhypophila decipiens]|uniref:Tyrosyl-DNA phosphodiesterase I n=1 Tax=Rhypophila decipiens TaxID=261697 RepID=A0AAN7B4N1_9PEZI|nr:tyrosyl-DNA phosphodiesterase I [Rhypophila decipiens]